MANFYFWSVGAMYVSLSAYVSLGLLGQNWRLLVLMCSVPCVSGMIAGITFIPKSPHRLVSTKGKPEEAFNILRGVTKQNGLDPTVIFPPGTVITSDTSTRMEEETTMRSAEEASIEDVVDVKTTPLKNMKDMNSVDSMTTTSDGKERTGYLWMFTKEWSWIMLNLMVAWFSIGFFYYSIILVVTQIFAHQHHSTFHFNYAAIIISSSAEVAGLFFTIPLLERYGRLWPQAWGYLLGGLSVVGMCYVNSLQASTLQHAVLVVLAFFARAFAMSCTSCGWMVTPEILTTNVRTTGHGFLNGMARIGAAISPFVLQATTPLPQVATIVSSVAVVVALAVWQLPETKGQVLGKGVNQVSWYGWASMKMGECSECSGGGVGHDGQSIVSI